MPLQRAGTMHHDRTPMTPGQNTINNMHELTDLAFLLRLDDELFPLEMFIQRGNPSVYCDVY